MLQSVRDIVKLHSQKPYLTLKKIVYKKTMIIKKTEK